MSSALGRTHFFDDFFDKINAIRAVLKLIIAFSALTAMAICVLHAKNSTHDGLFFNIESILQFAAIETDNIYRRIALQPENISFWAQIAHVEYHVNFQQKHAFGCKRKVQKALIPHTPSSGTLEAKAY